MNPVSTMRAKVVRLAYEKPELRAALLPLVASVRVAKTWTWRTLDTELARLGAYPYKTWPDSKDRKRISDIVDRKAPGDPAKQFALASRMAKLIKKLDKAIRRGRAAEDAGVDALAQVFYNRAIELAGGRPTRVVAPERSESTAPSRPSFTAPAPKWVPSTVDDWQLYDIPGAARAARALGKVMSTALGMAGRKITPQNTDAKNAKVIKKLMDRVDRSRNTYADFGAADTEGRVVMKDAFEAYLKQYLDRWDFPETYDTIDEWW